MATRSLVLPISTTPVLLASNATHAVHGALDVFVRNAGTTSVYIGGPDVAAADGYELAAGASLTVQLPHFRKLVGLDAVDPDALFAVSDGAGVVHVLRIGSV